MSTGVTELYSPRSVEYLGLWDVGHIKLKIYGVVAAGKELTSSMIDDAKAFVVQDLPPLVSAEGDDNGLGFVIIHPGDLGISVLAHWWIQGSVLCQHIRRTLWGADRPMNTATRPVIACVWELGLINAEQQLWRDTMMTGQPDAGSYLNSRAAIAVV
ncbi:hypothetical protein [Agrobacterium arsenijevicii]|uniref:Uncharacterized protein n=1 Tax=Agrobacterium arsenijevicii TaxID=1585697 RepID=A0ABR5CZV8_9HYPH|nr:hypothetical protein RP75_28190 [Agrobacterium arsenijevicii]